MGLKRFPKVRPRLLQQTTFSSDYPQKGFVHKVEKGETVSSIAKKYESKVKWIIDANQIADPTKVFVGKELFVPQK
jgi:LysM repeat protein